MSPQFSIPIAISLLAFLIADGENFLTQRIFIKSLHLGDRLSIEKRLAKLGRTSVEDYENFRIFQLTLIAFGTALSTLLLFSGLISWLPYCTLLVFTFSGVWMISDRNLTQRCDRRVREIESEFPAVIEMITLAVGAGESPASALKRISARATGHLAREFGRVVTEIENGDSFTLALDELSRRLSSDAIRRFVDSLVISISRGSSLVDTLTHSANEARNQERVRLLTAAGKSEISMMIPVVFLILPISILFALYPSLTNLNLFSG